MNGYSISSPWILLSGDLKGSWGPKEERPLKPLNGRKAVRNLIIWPKLDRCMVKLNTDAGGPSHPFRVFPHHHPLAKVSYSSNPHPGYWEGKREIGLLS